MDLTQFLSVLRRFVRSVAICAVLGVVIAAGLTLAATPQYQASVRLFVSTEGGLGDISQLAQGETFTQERVKSYAAIVGSQSVMSAVISDLHLQMTTKALAKKVSASAPVDTVLINVSVQDSSPSLAQEIANDVGNRFTAFVNQLEAQSQNGQSPVKVSVVQPASLPTEPVSPKKTLDLALGAIVGLLVGLLQAVVRSNLDTTIKGGKDVDEIVGKPIVGLIPFDPDATNQPVITDLSPHSLRAEAFRALRTNLQFVDIDNPPKSIVVTSSVPKEGKSTSTANLAITMARAGLKVCLVEADLRRPRLMKYLGIQGQQVGLTDVLIGRVQLDQAVSGKGASGVSFLASGTTPPNPSELLASAAMKRIIDELEQDYDIVLIDAPPLLPVTDAAVLSAFTDGVLLVVRAGSTHRDQLARSSDLLNAVDARVLGVVLNRVDRKNREGYGYYYYYYDAQPGEGRGRRAKGDKQQIFTPEPHLPVSRKPRESPVEQTGPLPKVSPAPAFPVATGERAGTVRDAVMEAFNRGVNAPRSDEDPPPTV